MPRPDKLPLPNLQSCSTRVYVLWLDVPGSIQGVMHCIQPRWTGLDVATRLSFNQDDDSCTVSRTSLSSPCLPAIQQATACTGRPGTGDGRPLSTKYLRIVTCRFLRPLRCIVRSTTALTVLRNEDKARWWARLPPKVEFNSPPSPS